MWVMKNGEQGNPPFFGNEKMLRKNAPFALTSETLSHHKDTNNAETDKKHETIDVESPNLRPGNPQAGTLLKMKQL
jgi:hypothetical protein